jgi:hypothetical protein
VTQIFGNETEESFFLVGKVSFSLFHRQDQGCQIFSVQTYQNGKIYQITTNYTKRPYIILNGRKIQMVIKYYNIFSSKALQILPNLGFLVRKETIWQPWSRLERGYRESSRGGRPTKKALMTAASQSLQYFTRRELRLLEFEFVRKL